jgi:SAM-dependent methyltransferase
VNGMHHWLCQSRLWRRTVQAHFLPWVLQEVKPSDYLLELGPGPGVTTDLLRGNVKRLTAIEIDGPLARDLAARLAGTNVTVVAGDAARLPFAHGCFSSAVCFTMLHHVLSRELQDTLFREVRRVLKPDGIFTGVDIGPSFGMRLVHWCQPFVPVAPASLAVRLRAAGFKDVAVETGRWVFRFRGAAA